MSVRASEFFNGEQKCSNGPQNECLVGSPENPLAAIHFHFPYLSFHLKDGRSDQLILDPWNDSYSPQIAQIAPLPAKIELYVGTAKNNLLGIKMFDCEGTEVVKAGRCLVGDKQGMHEVALQEGEQIIGYRSHALEENGLRCGKHYDFQLLIAAAATSE